MVWGFFSNLFPTFTSDFTPTYYAYLFLPQQIPSSSLTLRRLLGITSCYYHFRFHAILYWFLPCEGTWTPENSFDLFKEQPGVLSSLLFFYIYQSHVAVSIKIQSSELKPAIPFTWIGKINHREKIQQISRLYQPVQVLHIISRGPELKRQWTEAINIPVPSCSSCRSY